MPIVGWYCPLHLRNVDFDHFEEENCYGASPFLTHYARNKAQTDIRHSTFDTTVTQVQDCPRAIFLDRSFDYHPDPQTLALRERGTACHEATIPKLPTDPTLPFYYITEASDRVRSEVNGELWGMPFSGKFDAVKVHKWDADSPPRIVQIIDAKFPKDGSVRYRKKKNGMASAEHAAQLNMLLELLKQQAWVREGFDIDPDIELGIWDHAIGDTDRPIYFPAPHLTMEQVGNIRPWGSPFTVREMAQFLRGVRRDVLEDQVGTTLRDKEFYASTLPMVGVAMGGDSQWKCKGCSVGRLCADLVQKYGKPQ